MFVKISSVANAREPLARCPERGFYQFKKGCFRTLVKTTIIMKSAVVVIASSGRRRVKLVGFLRPTAGYFSEFLRLWSLSVCIF